MTEIVEILKSSNDLLEAELKILRLFSSLLCEALGTSLEQLDQELEKDANVKVLRRDQRTIQFLFGEVTFKRRLVEETGGYHVYLLDRHLEIKPRKRYSPLLLARVSGLASKGVVRTVASAVNLLTPISMSHQKVAGVIKEAGARIDNYQQQGINDTVGKNKPMILYLEGMPSALSSKHFIIVDK